MIAEIKQTRKLLSGIYKITNKKNGKCYVGKSVDVRNRMNTHYRELIKNNHYNYLLQHDFNLYGESAFEFSVLHKCKEQDLNDYESYFCYRNDVWKSGYNIAKLSRTEVSVEKDVRREFINHLCSFDRLLEVVNNSDKDISVEDWKIAESVGLDEKKVRKIVNTLTPEEQKQMPFVVRMESFGFGVNCVVFRSIENEKINHEKIMEALDRL